MNGPKLLDRRNQVFSLPQDPMTDHSETASKSWGGVYAGKRKTLRGTDLALLLSRIILLILHSLWKGQCGQGEPRSLQCLGLRTVSLLILIPNHTGINYSNMSAMKMAKVYISFKLNVLSRRINLDQERRY